jgi:hypothetical protein
LGRALAFSLSRILLKRKKNYLFFFSGVGIPDCKGSLIGDGGGIFPLPLPTKIGCFETSQMKKK